MIEFSPLPHIHRSCAESGNYFKRGKLLFLSPLAVYEYVIAVSNILTSPVRVEAPCVSAGQLSRTWLYL